MTEFSPAQIEYLGSQRLGRLATKRPDGTLQNNPVGFRYNQKTGTIDIGGFKMGATRKFRNVVANGQVAFVVDDIKSVDPWQTRMVEIRGTAEPIANDDPAKATIRIRPSRIISAGIE